MVLLLLLLLLLHAADEQGIAARGRWCGGPGEPPTPTAHMMPQVYMLRWLYFALTPEAVLLTFLCACAVSSCIITFHTGITLRQRHRTQVTSTLPVFLMCAHVL